MNLRQFYVVRTQTRRDAHWDYRAHSMKRYWSTIGFKILVGYDNKYYYLLHNLKFNDYMRFRKTNGLYVHKDTNKVEESHKIHPVDLKELKTLEMAGNLKIFTKEDLT